MTISQGDSVSDIVGVRLLELQRHGDDRGYFVETYREEWLEGERPMLQSNRAERRAGAVVGLHFHRFQSDYWYAVDGVVRVALRDLRVGSPSEGANRYIELGRSDESGQRREQALYIPPGVGHGFAALTDICLTYQVDSYYDPNDELGVRWDDREMALLWGVTNPVVSGRDCELASLAEWTSAGELPIFGSVEI